MHYPEKFLTSQIGEQIHVYQRYPMASQAGGIGFPAISGKLTDVEAGSLVIRTTDAMLVIAFDRIEMIRFTTTVHIIEKAQ